MAWPLGARIHAFLHGLFRPSEAALVRAQYDEVSALFAAAGIGTADERERLIGDLAAEVAETLAIPPDREQAELIHAFTERLFAYEALYCLPEIDWSQSHTIAALWDHRAEITRQRDLLTGFAEKRALVADAITAMLSPLYTASPALRQDADAADGIRIETSLLENIANLGSVTQAMIGVPFAEDVAEAGILTRLADRLERNLVGASGGNPAHLESFTRAPKLPEQYDAKSPEQLISAYLSGTPLLPLFNQSLAFTLKTTSRFEHHHIVAGSGHGKTQTLQYLIGSDLEAVAKGERSIVVLDSQGDLINTIANLEFFAPGQPLHARVVIIDPSDVEWPVSLNLFDVGLERLAGYAPLERERLTNSILELYDFVLGTLLSAEMTQKQTVIFRYVTRLMLHIPDATIHTLRELMEPGSEKTFAADIAKLSGTARHFFQTEFASKEFEPTKKQVLRRLWGILENQTFERMFAHPRSKLDLFAEMNAGKVILINTAKDLLKEQGTEIFGRFFIALIAQAAQERATLPAHKRTPTIVYIDEAQDYFDRNIGLILAQARKYNVGMVLAHQYLGQLEPKLQEAFAANTAIKFAGGVSAKDARALASMMYCSPELIERQPKASFAAHVRGQTTTAVPLGFPLGYMEKLPRMEPADRAALRTKMRQRYAVHVSECMEPGAQAEPESATPEPIEPRKSPPGHIDTEAGETW